MAAAPSAPQYLEGDRHRRRVGVEPEVRAAHRLVRPQSGLRGAGRAVRRPRAVGANQSPHHRVIRSPGPVARRQRRAQRGVRVGRHAGRRRRVGDAGRDDAGRPGVVDCGRLLQIDCFGQPRVRPGTVLQHAALRRRQRCGARGHSRQRAQRGHRLRLRPVDGFAAPRARLWNRVRALRLSRRRGVVEPARERHGAAQCAPRQGRRLVARHRARRRRIRAVGDRVCGCRRNARSRRWR